MSKPVQKLGFYITPEHACSYLSDKQATTLFADPHFHMDRHLYTQLAHNGFRRSGEYLYKPYCNNCKACIPVRIPVREFSMRRSHSRIWKQNQDLDISRHSSAYKQAHFDLYCRYLNARHKGGGMDNPDRDTYTNFLKSSWMETVFYEIKLNDLLLAVAVVDQLNDGLSAVYTFYDPDFSKRSLGIFSILYEIRESVRLGLDWLYLGYWIEGCAKMNYKNQFDPVEYLQDDIWTRTPRHG